MEKSQLLHNIEVHNKIAKKYEARHGEIYNEIEQSRLKESLENTLSYIETGNRPFFVLDFGCGAGNLTKHLTDIGCNVLAADISTGFLDLVSSRVYKNKVSTIPLNGIDLTGIDTESVDMVAMYSVLHHVPDYLSLMKEFSRVLKRGGVIYIDHELSSSYWDNEEGYFLFQKEMARKLNTAFKKYFIFDNYVNKIRRMFFSSKYHGEGDIHVFQDDHIEWEDIRNKLIENNISIVKEEDYLLYRKGYDNEVFEKWKNKTKDIHLLVGVKR